MHRFLVIYKTEKQGRTVYEYTVFQREDIQKAKLRALEFVKREQEEESAYYDTPIKVTLEDVVQLGADEQSYEAHLSRMQLLRD